MTDVMIIKNINMIFMWQKLNKIKNKKILTNVEPFTFY